MRTYGNTLRLRVVFADVASSVGQKRALSVRWWKCLLSSEGNVSSNFLAQGTQQAAAGSRATHCSTCSCHCTVAGSGHSTSRSRRSAQTISGCCPSAACLHHGARPLLPCIALPHSSVLDIALASSPWIRDHGYRSQGSHVVDRTFSRWKGHGSCVFRGTWSRSGHVSVGYFYCYVHGRGSREGWPRKTDVACGILGIHQFEHVPVTKGAGPAMGLVKMQ